MKGLWLVFCGAMFLIASAKSWSQEPRFLTASGGYSFVNVEDVSKNGTGWRANILYQGIEHGATFAHGYAIGFITVSASKDSLLPKVNPLSAQEQTTIDYTVSSVPLYYAPMYQFGGDRLKGFVKGALGVQMAWLTRKGPNTKVTDTDMGWYLGASAGVAIPLSEKMAITAEYEWAFATNSFYKDGFVNSALAGLRFML